MESISFHMESMWNIYIPYGIHIYARWNVHIPCGIHGIDPFHMDSIWNKGGQ